MAFMPSQCLTCVELLAEVGPHEFLRHLSRRGVDDQLRTEVEEIPVGSGDAVLGGRGVRTQIGNGDDVAPNGTAEGRGLDKEGRGRAGQKGTRDFEVRERRRSAADRPTDRLAASQPAHCKVAARGRFERRKAAGTALQSARVRESEG